MSTDFENTVALVERWYDAYNGRDLARVREISHERIEVISGKPLMAPLKTAALVTTSFVYDVDKPGASKDIWSVFEVEDDLIVRVRAYASEEEALVVVADDSLLTRREREVFELLAEGLTAGEVAEKLCLSPFTVRTHIQNARGRLGAKTRMHALSIAMKRGEIRA